MDLLATPEDLIRILRDRPPSAIALCRIDPRATEEVEKLLSRSFADSCWRLSDGRYAGVFEGDVRVKAEALRREVDGLQLTLTIGLSLPRPDLSPSDLLLKAEQALTTARQAGGNRVELAPRQDTSKTERNRLGRKRP